MADLSLDLPVATVVARHPATSRVFERRGIDYCCQGKRTLAESCAAKGLDAGLILAELLAAEDTTPAEPDPDSLTMTALADHIESTHHAMLKTELPRLSAMAAKVEHAHGEGHPELREARRVLDALAADMSEHMAKEERILFPAIRKLEREQTGAAWIVQGAIRCMVHEHEDAGRALEALRTLTSNYTPPSGACPTYRAFFHGLQELETDMHRHVHKENYILFPKAAAAFDAMAAGPKPWI